MKKLIHMTMLVILLIMLAQATLKSVFTVYKPVCDDFSVNVETQYTVFYEKCEIIGYAFDDSHPQFTDINNTLYV